MKLLVLFCAVAAASANFLAPGLSHYHAQDALGQYSYAYSGGPSAKHETRTLDGVTRGGYSYLDSHGLVQSAAYVADPVNGFRVAATNLPVGPAVPAHPLGLVHGLFRKRRDLAFVGPLSNDWAVLGQDTPAVAAAKVAHTVAHQATAVRDAWGHAGVYSAGAPLAAVATAGDTYPVAALKVAHADTHARTTLRDHLGHWGGFVTGAPVLNAADTPDVTVAKVAHGVAHVGANLRLAGAHAHGLLWRKKRSPLFGVGVAAPLSSQYHAQDGLGHYNYGYANPISSMHAARGFGGSNAFSYNTNHGLIGAPFVHAAIPAVF